MSMLDTWRRAAPDWAAWLSALDLIFRKEHLYYVAFAIPGTVYAGTVRQKLARGDLVVERAPSEAVVPLTSVIACADSMALGEYVAPVVVPGAGMDASTYIGFVACGREPDWERFRMQACMRLATEVITGKLPEELRPVFLSIAPTNDSPVMFGGAIFAAYGKLDALLEYIDFRGYHADDRSGLVMPVARRRAKKEVALVGARTAG